MLIKKFYRSFWEEDMTETTAGLLDKVLRSVYQVLGKDEQLQIATKIYQLTDGALSLFKVLDLPLCFSYALQQTYFEKFKCYLQRILMPSQKGKSYNYFFVDLKENKIFTLREKLKKNPQKIKNLMVDSVLEGKNYLYKEIEEEATCVEEKAERFLKIDMLSFREETIEKVKNVLYVDKVMTVGQEILF